MSTIQHSRPQNDQIPEQISAWRDWLGVTASVCCAIHCAAMPFLIAWLPAMGLRFLADESFHKWMALVCFLIAIVAFIPGLRKHRNWTPVSIGAIGLVLITFAAFGLAGECCPACEAMGSNTANATTVASSDSNNQCDQCSSCASCIHSDHEPVAAIAFENHGQKDLLSALAPWITPLGGVILVSAHLLNRRFGSLCGCC